jgi:hypothetical protein
MLPRYWRSADAVPQFRMRGSLLSVLIVGIALSPVFAKDTPFQVVAWPDSGQTLLRFTFSKIKEMGGMGRERTYVTDTMVENLSDKTVGSATFSPYVFDKNKARIGEGYINLSNVAASQTVKFQVTLAASGTPTSLAVSASNASRTVSITVNSVPQGALLKVDGKDMGTTPKIVEVAIGKHSLDFSKGVSTPGNFPWKSRREILRAAALATSSVARCMTLSNCAMGPCYPETSYRSVECKWSCAWAGHPKHSIATK